MRFNSYKNISYLPYYLISISVSILVIVPLFEIFSSFFENSTEYFQILKNTFLSEYIYNSILILLWVLVLTFFFGFFSAYLVSFYEFPGSSFFENFLILSFAIPGYIYAYSLTAFFENYGTAYSILTNLFGEKEFNNYIPKFDGVLGAILSMSFSLFGYVFILTRTSFFSQTNNLIEVGKNLGFSKKKTFSKIIIPCSRPAIITGLSLVAMECLSDFGVVTFFSISTLTTGIYNAWISFDDLATANRLAFILLIFIFFLFIIENLSRKKAKYHIVGKLNSRKNTKTKLTGYKALLSILFCGMLFFCSFIFPVTQMLYWTLKFPNYIENINFIKLNFNTLYLVLISSSILLIFSLVSNLSNRVIKSKILNLLNFLSISGYAIPGIILALALMTFSSWLTNVTNINFKSYLIGSTYGLVLAYFIRFYALSYSSINSSFQKLNKSIDENAYILGFSNFKIFSNIHFPFLKKSCLLIFILVAIEIIKELPITLILRPFNFETFSTKAYSYAEQDLLEAAAFPSLCLIFWCTIFIIISNRFFLSQKKS